MRTKEEILKNLSFGVDIPNKGRTVVMRLTDVYEAMEEYAQSKVNELSKANVIKSVCDCTNTQACKKCADEKGIDWSIIEPR